MREGEYGFCCCTLIVCNPRSCFIAGAGMSLPSASALQRADLETVRARMRVGSHASGAETSFPRKGGVGRLATSDSLSEFAGLRIGPAIAGGACPAFLKTRDSWSTVSATAGPKRRCSRWWREARRLTPGARAHVRRYAGDATGAARALKLVKARADVLGAGRRLGLGVPPSSARNPTLSVCRR
jgi:hypothetical protein